MLFPRSCPKYLFLPVVEIFKFACTYTSGSSCKLGGCLLAGPRSMKVFFAHAHVAGIRPKSIRNLGRDYSRVANSSSTFTPFLQTLGLIGFWLDSPLQDCPWRGGDIFFVYLRARSVYSTRRGI